MDGSQGDMGGPIGFPEALIEMRELMHIPGMGSRFTLCMKIINSGETIADFGYGNPGDDALSWLDLEGDLPRNPPDEVPKWSGHCAGLGNGGDLRTVGGDSG
ncbi:hypothetical protein ACIP5Y_33055 [Nocardia sp. NPDC088792]|uniref:hypothetical protein n=1 Tax=Nocardia sp. NPDC088792 TaxID=3364332 RepID=UPI003808BAAE